MNLRHPVRRRAAGTVAAAALALVSLTACGGGDSDQPTAAASEAGEAGQAGETPDLAELQAESGVPEECLEAFPVAMGAADAATVTLAPADWPADAVDGTLCQTTETPDGSRQSLEYASSASADAVLDALEAALPASYGTVREDKGAGEQLDGAAGDVYFTVTTRPGAYVVAFATG